MITEHDLQEAIAECQGQRNPNASTCIKLAAFLIIQREMYGETNLFVDANKMAPSYSYADEPIENLVDIQSDTEFAQAVNGRRAEDIWPVMDELIATLQVVNPRLYASLMRQLEEG